MRNNFLKEVVVYNTYFSYTFGRVPQTTRDRWLLHPPLAFPQGVQCRKVAHQGFGLAGESIRRGDYPPRNYLAFEF